MNHKRKTKIIYSRKLCGFKRLRVGTQHLASSWTILAGILSHLVLFEMRFKTKSALKIIFKTCLRICLVLMVFVYVEWWNDDNDLNVIKQYIWICKYSYKFVGRAYVFIFQAHAHFPLPETGRFVNKTHFGFKGYGHISFGQSKSWIQSTKPVIK